MQTVAPGSPYLSMGTACVLVYQDRGRSFSKIYYGVGMNCTRALLSWGIINASYEVIRSFLYSKPELEGLRASNKSTGESLHPRASCCASLPLTASDSLPVFLLFDMCISSHDPLYSWTRICRPLGPTVRPASLPSSSSRVELLETSPTISHSEST